MAVMYCVLYTVVQILKNRLFADRQFEENCSVWLQDDLTSAHWNTVQNSALTYEISHSCQREKSETGMFS